MPQDPDASLRRWIVYLSPDRRILWTDDGGDPATDSPFDQPADIQDLPPALREWHDLLDAAYATRMPQAASRRLAVDGVEREYTLKAFPDIGLDGELKGVIQVVETGGRQTGTALRKNISALLDLTLNGVILYHPPDDRILNINRRVAQQTGYAMAELLRLPGRALFGDGGAALLASIFARMSVAGEAVVWGQILGVNDRYGRRREYFCSLRPVPVEPKPDAPPAMLISLDETSRPAEADEAPTPRFITEALEDGLWEFDTRRKTFHYSASFAELMGPEGAPGAPGKTLDAWLDAVHPSEAEKVFSRWRDLLKRGSRYRIQYRVRDSKGDWRWIFATIHAVLNDASGRPRRILGFHHDITEAIHTERNLADAEERLRTIFENTGSGIAVAGVDGALLQVNPALAIMLGRNREDFYGRRLSDFAHAEDRHGMKSILSRITRGGQREVLDDIRLVRPDGRVVWVNLNVTISAKMTGGGRYVILMVDDVSGSHEHRMRMQYEATHDVMTGAWSRWVLFERLEQHLTLAQRHDSPLTFCICDLDRFKNVNDMYGHQAGDRVLVEFVRILKESVRETDIVGRYGGEEFGVVFPQTAILEARRPLERARRLLRETRFDAPGGETFSVTATFGLAAATRTSTIKSLVAMADSALYDGKRAGRDRLIECPPPPGEDVV